MHSRLRTGRETQQRLITWSSFRLNFFQDNTIAELVQHNIRVHYSGDISRFPEETIQILQKVQAATSGCSGMILNMALNYGGKAEVLQACKSYIQTVIDGNEKLEDFSEDVFEQYLYTNGLPPVDLMIRTSGEVRLSNFLLWQSGSSELWFTKELWPDFNRGLLMEQSVIISDASRNGLRPSNLLKKETQPAPIWSFKTR